MKKLLAIVMLMLMLSCAKKELKIPTLAEKGIQELQNHSQVWFFFELKNNDSIVNVNQKNTISTTHWIFNIDKRLPLKTIIPPIIKLQDKHANSMHSVEGMRNYFSYADTVSKNISFLEFEIKVFETDSILSKDFIKKDSIIYSKFNNIHIIFNKKNSWVNAIKIAQTEFKLALLEYINSTSKGRQTMLHLNFNQNLLYQDYLFYKKNIHALKSDLIISNPIEFIFDKNKVQDCACE